MQQLSINDMIMYEIGIIDNEIKKKESEYNKEKNIWNKDKIKTDIKVYNQIKNELRKEIKSYGRK